MLGIYLAIIDDEQDRVVFKRIYKQYKGYLYTVAFNILQDSNEAEDVLQDAFIKIAHNIKKINISECDKTRHYIVIIVRSVCMDFLRAKKRRLPLSYEEETEQQDMAEPVQELVENQQLLDLMPQYIKRLPQRYADVLTLRYFEDCSLSEIAELLGTTNNNVSNIIARAQALLKKDIIKDGWYDR